MLFEYDRTCDARLSASTLAMESRASLNKRATSSGGNARSLLHVGRGTTFWTGTSSYLAEHQGGAPVLLAGLGGNFRLRLGGGPWLACGAAIVVPGVWHALDFDGQPFAALYVEPNVGSYDVLLPLLKNSREVTGALVGACGVVSLLRRLYEDGSSAGWVADAIVDLVTFTRRRPGITSIDPRVSTAVEFLHQHADELTPVSRLANAQSISPGRFQHVFTRQVGVPFRRYRAWARLRLAWLAMSQGKSCTAAAHEAGFSDSAHFSREFRRTFGSCASNRVSDPQLRVTSSFRSPVDAGSNSQSRLQRTKFAH